MPTPRRSNPWLRLTIVVLVCVATGAGHLSALNCGPFTDVPDTDPYCPAILQLYYLGITSGTSSTTFGPTLAVTRQALAVLLARAGSSAVPPGASRRAVLGQFWTTGSAAAMRLTTVGNGPIHVVCDGNDIWVGNGVDSSVSRVRGSDGKLEQTWTGAVNPRSLLSAMGYVFVAGLTSPGSLYQIDPQASVPGPVTTVVSTLPDSPVGIAFDGSRIWTTNASGSVSIITPGTWSVTNAFTGFAVPIGIVFDGANMWVADNSSNNLLKLNSAGTIIQTIPVGSGPANPVFDGTNIWVPNINDDSVTVVRASTGAVVTTLTGNGLADPIVAAFDGQRVLVTSGLDAVSIWKASDLSVIGTTPTGGGTGPHGVCSDGIAFWIALENSDQLARF